MSQRGSLIYRLTTNPETKVSLIMAAMVLVMAMFLTSCDEGNPSEFFDMKIDGVTIHFDSGGFNYLITDVYHMGGYLKGSDPSDHTKNIFQLQIPRDAKVGNTYDQTSKNVSLQYTDQAGKDYYSTYTGASCSITITKWLGVGKYGTGTFSGTLYSGDGTVKKVITDGTFLGTIYN